MLPAVIVETPSLAPVAGEETTAPSKRRRRRRKPKADGENPAAGDVSEPAEQNETKNEE